MNNEQNQTISVIITVYNVKPYLSRCIESVLAQIYRDIEVWIVDDGSTDGSASLCTEYEQRDKRVHVIRQSNKGPGAARNTGTRRATGKYLTYVDGDDVLHPACLQIMLQEILEHKAQIATCGTHLLYDPAKRWDVSMSAMKSRCLWGEAGLQALLYQKDFDTSVWGKLYLTEIMQQITFPENCVYEDILPSVQVFAKSQKTISIATPLYGYLQRASSIMHQRNLQSCLDELKMSDQMYDWVVEHCPRQEAAALHKKFSNYCQVLRALRISNENAEQIRSKVLCFLRQNARRILMDHCARRKNRCAALLLMFCPQLFEKIS